MATEPRRAVMIIQVRDGKCCHQGRDSKNWEERQTGDSKWGVCKSCVWPGACRPLPVQKAQPRKHQALNRVVKWKHQ